MSPTQSFSDIVEAVETLSAEERQTLVDLVQRRLAEERRRALIADVTESRREMNAGGCPSKTVDEIMNDLLS